MRDSCTWYSVYVLQMLCVSCSDFLQTWRAATLLVPWACYAMCAVEHCDLYAQWLKGPLHPCGPVHNQRLTQLRSVLLPVLWNPYPCVRQHGLHTVNGVDDLQGQCAQQGSPSQLVKDSFFHWQFLELKFGFAWSHLRSLEETPCCPSPTECYKHLLKINSLFLAPWTLYCDCTVERNRAQA